MSVENRFTFPEVLKPCPLCGSKVQMEVTGRIYMETMHSDLPTFYDRCVIKCPSCFLNLDVGRNGYVHAKGKTESEQRSMLEAIMINDARDAKERWNRRADNLSE